MDDTSHIALLAGTGHEPVTQQTASTAVDVDVAAARAPEKRSKTTRRRTGQHRRREEGWEPPDRIITESEREAMTGYSRVWWYKLEKRGEVPARIKLGARKIGFSLREIEAWLAARAALRTAGPSAPPSDPTPLAAGPRE